MNSEEFREAGKQMIDYIADYLENIRERPVLPSVEPFYIKNVVPSEPPYNPEPWNNVFQDIEKVVMNGMTHWHSPYFYSYFPTGNSYPGILGGMLSDALSCIGFSWYSSPACTELEMQMCDWMVKALGLPDFFLFSSFGNGGGIIQGSMSEATLVTFLSAKKSILTKIENVIRDVEKLREKKKDQENKQNLKQGLYNFYKDLLKITDELQEKKFKKNKECLKEEYTKFMNFFSNNITKKDSDIEKKAELDQENILKENFNQSKNNLPEHDNVSNESNFIKDKEILDLHLHYMAFSDKSFNTKTAKLVSYCSSQAHSSVEKAALLSSVIIRKIDSSSLSEDDLSLDGLALEKAILQDLENGFIPFHITVTLGTTSSLVFDKLDEIGPIAKKYGLWLHVDAAYAGSAFICPEYRYLLKGIEYTDSFAMNPHKWLLVNFDCSILWVKHSNLLDQAFNVSPAYLKYEKEGMIPDYRHWQIPLGRRFRSLKLWFVIRVYGISGLQKHIRKQIQLAIAFSNLITKNERFEIINPVLMGLVCFRLKGTNEKNSQLVSLINQRKNIHMMSTQINNLCVIRFAICSRFTELNDIKFAYNEILAVIDLLDKQDKELKKN